MTHGEAAATKVVGEEHVEVGALWCPDCQQDMQLLVDIKNKTLREQCDNCGRLEDHLLPYGHTTTVDGGDDAPDWSPEQNDYINRS